MIKILHFADAHIDIANYGRHDPEDGLPMRIKDFLASLDEIVDAAIDQKVDLVIFAGDAFKDRNPSPTFQREWAKRIRRLSQEKIETIIVVGNHDRSASIAHANALDVYQTLHIPHIHIGSKPLLLQSEDLNGVKANVIIIPWLMRDDMRLYLEMSNEEIRNREVSVYQDLLQANIDQMLNSIENDYPCILAAHATVETAVFGEETNIAIGGEFILPMQLLKDQRFDYVALGHIHHAQNLNENSHPPVIYAGSIERVSFNEAKEAKYYVIADIEKGQTNIKWCELKNIRPYLDLYVNLKNSNDPMPLIQEKIPTDGTQKEAVVRMILEYDQENETKIDDNQIRKQFEDAFSFNLVKRPVLKNRIRLGEEQYAGDLTEEELLQLYWQSKNTTEEKAQDYIKLAKQIIEKTHNGDEHS